MESLDERIVDLEEKIRKYTNKLADLPDAWNGKIEDVVWRTGIEPAELAIAWAWREIADQPDGCGRIYGYFRVDGTLVTDLLPASWEYWSEGEDIYLMDVDCHALEWSAKEVRSVIGDLLPWHRRVIEEDTNSLRNELAILKTTVVDQTVC